MPISGTTGVLTILAHPSNKVTAPLVYNPIFEQLNLDLAYIAHDVAPENLAVTIESLRHWRNLRGFNVTIPHKEAAAEMIDSLCPVSRRIRAVNTVVRTPEGRLLGYNTDGLGALTAIGGAHEANVLVLGAGGAARAIIAALLDDGARSIKVLNRSAERVQELLELFGDERLSVWQGGDLSAVDILVQVTPLSESLPFNLELERLPRHCRVFESIMRPTVLAERASALGLKLIKGYGMLYHQTAANFRLFTGRELPPELLNEAFAGLGYRP